MMKMLVSVLVAALLLVGTSSVGSVPENAEYGLQQMETVTTPEEETSVAPEKSVEAETTAAEETAVQLTADEAKAIALNHAGFTASQVSGLRAEYDVDDGVPEYEVEFRSGDYEYDYTIHAKTGKILKNDKEYDPVKTTSITAKASATATPEPKKSTAAETTTETTTKKLTADEAKAIALNHAGFTASQVSGLRAEYDVDDGVPEYEVEFRAEGWEYDYEIHAETGKILSYDKDE